MNKTNFIILSIVLCFSLIFAVHPLRTFADGNLTYGASGTSIGSLGGGITVVPTVSLGTVGESPSAWTIDYTGQSQTTFAADPAFGGYIYTPPVPVVKPYKEEQYSGWFCNSPTESCFYAQKQSPGYSTQEQCEANCIYCRYCRKWGVFSEHMDAMVLRNAVTTLMNAPLILSVVEKQLLPNIPAVVYQIIPVLKILMEHILL